MLASILSVLVSGFLIGALARLAIPGPDPMPFWLTVLIGLGGSVIGGGIAIAIYGSSDVLDNPDHAFVGLLLEIGAAAVIVVLYRRYVQHRPISGPDARRFPTRGVGVSRMRERLRQFGVDPDRLTGVGPAKSKPPELTPEEIAKRLERLRDRRDKGELTEEQYQEERERLRRY